jgi:g-D-glutamyl-meso-diaminopimelate peptidase
MPAAVLSLHTQGEEIYYRGGGCELAGVRAAAMRLASLSGYRLGEPSGPAAYGGLCDYTTASLGIPSFTVECGRGENPLPPQDAPLIYARLRRMLFESVTM